MFLVELIRIRTLSVDSYGYHFDLLHPSESTTCVLYISDQLNELLKKYIPSGIMLFDQSKIDVVKPALNDIYDRICNECADDFDYRTQTEPILVNLKYAFSMLKTWCYDRGNLIFRVTHDES